MTTRRRINRHTFIFKVRANNGEEQTVRAPAKVRRDVDVVRLILTADHVRAAMKAKGAGNTQNCSMAICAIQHRTAFDHPVVGYIDWFYTRAYVASRLHRNGLPIECYEYAHSDDIGRLNDTPGGMKKLLAQLEANGPREIVLHPVPKQKPETRRGTGHRGNYDGSKSSRGAKLRHAVAQLGGV
jgi:hypothetical protein